MIRRLLSLYRFTRSEQISIVVLCLLIVVINIFGIFVKGNRTEALDITNTSTEVRKASTGAGPRIKDEKYTGIIEEKPQAKLLELNSADSISLQSLYGIGPSFASRIVKYRNLLGGYHEKDQLLEVYGMDSLRYNGFIARITIDRGKLKTININTAGFKDLLRHPYLDYEQVKRIVSYRSLHGPMEDINAFWRDSVLNDELRPRLKPYLSISTK